MALKAPLLLTTVLQASRHVLAGQWALLQSLSPGKPIRPRIHELTRFTPTHTQASSVTSSTQCSVLQAPIHSFIHSQMSLSPVINTTSPTLLSAASC